jgi:hypothetical protein
LQSGELELVRLHSDLGNQGAGTEDPGAGLHKLLSAVVITAPDRIGDVPGQLPEPDSATSTSAAMSVNLQLPSVAL